MNDYIGFFICKTIYINMSKNPSLPLDLHDEGLLFYRVY